MKRLHFKVIFFSTACLIFCNDYLTAQTNIQLKSFSIQVPLMVHDSYYSNVPNGQYSRSDDMGMILDFEGAFSTAILPTNYGDTLIFAFHELGQMGAENRKFALKFVFDSILGNFKSFSISYSFDTSFTNQLNQKIGVKDDGFIVFRFLNYVQINDSTLVINQIGNSCRKTFDTAGYSYSAQSVTGMGYTSGENHYADSVIRNDTGAYKCVLNFIHRASFNSVREFISIRRVLSISSFFPDHSTHFSFPPSDYSQTISIYDILGREVKRIEIPSGVSEYRLQRDGFMSGYYFARLGNMNAKFVVN